MIELDSNVSSANISFAKDKDKPPLQPCPRARQALL
jgi:hypothetical protein